MLDVMGRGQLVLGAVGRSCLRVLLLLLDGVEARRRLLLLRLAITGQERLVLSAIGRGRLMHLVHMMMRCWLMHVPSWDKSGCSCRGCRTIRSWSAVCMREMEKARRCDGAIGQWRRGGVVGAGR